MLTMHFLFDGDLLHTSAKIYAVKNLEVNP